MEKVKLSNNQLFSLTAIGTCGSAVILISSAVAAAAKQDAWISALLAAAFGIPVIWIYWFLGSRYPGMTFVEITGQILGKWLGLFVSAAFVFFCIVTAFQGPWYISDFIAGQAMPEMPGYIINMVFVIAAVITLLYGIEAIARASEIFLYFISVLFILAMILVLPNIRTDNIFPIFEKGIIPSLKGTFILSCTLTFPMIIIGMIYPRNADNIKKSKKTLLTGYLWGSFIILISILMSILVLGSMTTANSKYAIYLLAKEINIGAIFTRLEFIVAVVWIITLFLKDILYLYAGVIGLSQLFGFKNHKKIVLPIGLILLIMSDVIFPTSIYQEKWTSLVWAPYVTTIGLIMPVLLFCIYIIKRWMLKLYKKR